jgi:hypothetical protein
MNEPCAEERITGFEEFVQKYVSPSPHLKKETAPVSETLFSSYLEFRTMDKLLKPSDSESYTPSSETFKLYLC